MDPPLALVVDRDPVLRSRVRDVLEKQGIKVLDAASAPEALETLRTSRVGMLLLDLDAPGVAASDLIGTARRLRPAASVIALAAEGAADAAIAALREGALDVQLKPLDDPALALLAERAVRLGGLLRDCERLREEIRGRAGYTRLVGRSAAMQRLRDRLERLAAVPTHAWFHGETGVGKELAARTLHALSGWRERPFISVDCARPESAALDAELFGGAGGSGGLPGGLLGNARSSVVFLDSVLELAPALQDRLAERLELDERSGRRDGLPPIFCSTQADARRAAEQGRFREDLLGRLAPVSVGLPPLRERVEDIPLLVNHFIDSIREINELPPIQPSAETLAVLGRYRWPGNVRELRNAVEQGVILATDGVIRPRDLPEKIRGAEPEQSRDETVQSRIFKEAKREVVERFERAYLREILERNAGNVTAAAQQAGMLRSALQRLLRKYEIRSAEYRRRRRRPPVES